MRFSVCIPTYNRAAFLPKAIESVLSQSHTDFELVVLDNASTDETSDLLKQITDPRVRVFANEMTISMYANHNLCVQKAQEDWIVFLHSDDALLPGALATMAEYAARGDCAVVMPAKQLHFDAGLTGTKRLCHLGAVPEILRLPSATPTGSAICKTALLQQPYHEDEIAADLLFLAQVLGNGGCITIIPDPIIDIGMGDFQYTANWGGSGRQTIDTANVFRMIAEMPGVEKKILDSVPNWNSGEVARLLLLLGCAGKSKLVREIETALAPRSDYRAEPSYKHVNLQKILGKSFYNWALIARARARGWKKYVRGKFKK